MFGKKAFSLLTVFVILSFLTAASGKYLIGEDKTFDTIDVLYVVGPKVCRRECSRRSHCANTIYDKERLRCTLVSSGNSTIQIGDKSLKGHCVSVACARLEVCVELPNGAKCVRRDLPRDCKDVLKLEHKRNDIYTIFPFRNHHDQMDPVPVMCNMTHKGGGFTIVQRRLDGSIKFSRNWVSYASGFGDLDSEFWIGNYNLKNLTTYKSLMFIALEDHYGTWKFEEYSGFKIFTELFRLKYIQYRLSAGNSLENDTAFSTIDRDNDGSNDIHCAESNGGSGGWWYNNCSTSQLNGQYCKKGETGLHCNRWYTFQNDSRGMKTSAMLLRRFY